MAKKMCSKDDSLELSMHLWRQKKKRSKSSQDLLPKQNGMSLLPTSFPSPNQSTKAQANSLDQQFQLVRMISKVQFV